MNISQQLNHVIDNQYFNQITVEGIPNGYFIVVIKNELQEGSTTTRDMQVDLLPLQQSQGGTITISSGDYRRKEGETEVRVSLLLDGGEAASNTVAY